MMDDVFKMLLSEFREFRKEYKEEMKEFRAISQHILEFMGDSKRDRIYIHDRLDDHHERIANLEDEPKKKVQSNYS